MLFTVVSFSGFAQTDKATTKRIVEAKEFVFVAAAAIPINSTEINNVLSSIPCANRFGIINLNGENYDVRISPDSLVAYLPFYGRSFIAPIGQDETGYKFTSTRFTFETVAQKKGGWQISINPKDTKESVRMNLSIGENGYATLVVNSNNKQSITYNGYLVEPKKEKEVSK